MNKKRIYLDNNATTIIDPRILKIMWEELSGYPSNPSSSHFFGQKAKAQLIESTRLIADYFNVKSHEVFFTSGATEGLNATILGSIRQKSKGHIISSLVEHAAVYHCLKRAQEDGYEVTFLAPMSGTSSISKEQVKLALKPNTILITLMAANNETGELTDIESIASIAEEHRIPFIVDGVSILGKKDFSIPRGLSAICFSGHKIHAPKGIGLIIAKKKFKWDPLIVGGPQQQGKRGGTENLAGIIAFAKALYILKEERDVSIDKMKFLRNRLEEGLKKAFPQLLINGYNEKICNTTNISFPNVDGESLLFNLDLEGIAASHGSACMSGGLEPSRVLINMGLSKEIARSSIRFSLSKFTTQDEIDEATDIIIKQVRRLSSLQR